MKENRNKFKLQTNEYYAWIGKFINLFEHVCFELKGCCERYLEPNGVARLVPKIMLNNLTVYQLQEKFNLLSQNHFKGKNDNLLIIESVVKKVDELRVERNKMVHSQWYIGWTGPNQPEFDSYTRKTNRKKLKSENLFMDFEREEIHIEVLKSNTFKAAVIATVLARLKTCLDTDYSVSKNINIDMVEKGDDLKGTYMDIYKI